MIDQKVPNVTSLTNEVNRLTHSVDRWNIAIVVMMVLAAAAAVGLVLTQYVVIKRTKALASATDRLSEAKDKIAQQQIAETNERAATAEARAADANKTASSFQLDIANANERAAAANELAEKERLARLQLEARLSPRHLTNEQMQRIITVLRHFSHSRVTVVTFGDSAEVIAFSDEISSCLQHAGWVVLPLSAIGTHAPVQGVQVGYKPWASSPTFAASSRFVQLLQDAGIAAQIAEFDAMHLPSAFMGVGMAEATASPIRIFIGSKP